MSQIEWAPADDQALRDAYAQGLYARHTAALRALAARKGTTVRRCRYRAWKLGLTRVLRGRKPWTAQEDKFLEQHSATQSVRAIAIHLGRSHAAVAVRLSRKKLQASVANRGYTRDDLCALMGITERTLSSLLAGRRMQTNRYHNFSPAEVQLWIFDILETLELRRFDQEFLKKMIKGAAQ